jgi:CheY-like chemotaxis protein
MEPRMSNRNVLIIEDDVDIREALVGILRDEGYEAEGAGNGLEGLDHLRTVGAKPALILLDLMMPVMNGWQFRTEQQQDAALATIPVVVISADSNVKQKAASIDAAAYLKKPIELDALLDVVAKYCAS